MFCDVSRQKPASKEVSVQSDAERDPSFHQKVRPTFEFGELLTTFLDLTGGLQNCCRTLLKAFEFCSSRKCRPYATEQASIPIEQGCRIELGKLCEEVGGETLRLLEACVACQCKLVLGKPPMLLLQRRTETHDVVKFVIVEVNRIDDSLGLPQNRVGYRRIEGTKFIDGA